MMKPGQDWNHTMVRLRDLGFRDVEWDVVPRSYDTQMINSMSASSVLRSDGFARVQYRDMPEVLSRYQYYGEMYWNGDAREWYMADSSTGLQAMSLGLRVVRPDGSVARGLPDAHRPENVAARVRAVYDALLE